MYILYYQKDENVSQNYPFLFVYPCYPALLKSYWNGLRDYPVQPLERLQVSYYSFHLPTSTAWLKYQSFSKKFPVPLILQTCQTPMRYDTQGLWMINSSCFSIYCFSFNYFVLLLSKTDSNIKLDNNTGCSGKDQTFTLILNLFYNIVRDQYKKG